MKLLVMLAVSIAANVSGLHGAPDLTPAQQHELAHGGRACKGGACRVCKNCKYCKYCNSGKGHKCSVCK